MTNKDNFDTTYRKVKGFHIIGYDADTDTFSKLHVDPNGHIYTKLLGDKSGAMQELSVGEDGGLSVATVNQAIVVYESGDNLYVCKASIGTALSSSAWQIRKVNTTSGAVVQWADGNDSYDNLATDLATVAALSYS